jgi:hypothetical protein
VKELAPGQAREVYGEASPEDVARQDAAYVEDWAARLEVVIDGARVTYDTRREVAFDPATLGASVRDQSVRIAWWNGLVAKLARVAASLKIRIKRQRAEVGLEIRRGRLRVTTGKLSEALIADAVALDQRVTVLEDAAAEAEEKLDMARAIVEGLRHRKDMLYIEGLLQNSELRNTALGFRTGPGRKE